MRCTIAAGPPGWAARLFLPAALIFPVLVSRHPTGLLAANFWAEDGWFWYPQAYQLGWKCLLMPHTGYLQTFPRLMALACIPFPLLLAPTIFAVIATAVQGLPALFLLSRRMDRLWRNFAARLLFCLVYAAMPNAFEEMGNVTNSQWFLAVLAFLVNVSDPPANRWALAFDVGVLLLAGLTGPFCVFLLPISLYLLWRRPGRLALIRSAIVLATSVVQGLVLLTTMGAGRVAAPLGASFIGFCRIFVVQVACGGMLGMRFAARLPSLAIWESDAAVALLAGVGLALLVIALGRGSVLFRLGLVYVALIFTASLATPQISPVGLQWVLMEIPGVGQRYYLLPIIVWLGALFTCAADDNVYLRGIGMALSGLLLFGIANDFAYPAMPKTDFDARARIFATAPVGATMAFPLYPPTIKPMRLTKK